MIAALTKRVWTSADFAIDYEKVALVLARNAVGLPPETLDASTRSRVLRASAILALSPEPAHHRAAARIAVSILLQGDANAAELSAARLCLDRLAYFPTSDLTESEVNGAAGLAGRLAEPLWLETSVRREMNVLPGVPVPLTDVQLDMWEHLFSGKPLSVSAPTSAGKSFVLQHFIASEIEGGAVRCAYLVPTRALISQVSGDLRRVLRDRGMNSVRVLTVPAPTTAAQSVYVVTQERLHFLLESHATVHFDLVVVDEAQEIGKGSRGILLQSVLERVLTRGTCQVVMASPISLDASPALAVLGFDPKQTFRTEDTPVVQNLLVLERVDRKTRKCKVSVVLEDRLRDVGELDLSSPMRGTTYRLYASLVTSLPVEGSTLVFVGQPAYCERAAGDIADRRTPLSSGDDGYDEVLELSKFLKDHVHPEYPLAEHVLRGVAYHYSDMPAIVRTLIEDAFAEGRIKYLVCTSTLLAGVNLPARNLFMLNPTVGKDTPLSETDFWNLAGRPGRLAKDFAGNVFLINPAEWEKPPNLTSPLRETVRPAMGRELERSGAAIVEYLDGQGLDHALLDDDSEAAVAKLFSDLASGRLDERLNRIPGLSQQKLAAELSQQVPKARRLIDVPSEVLAKNITLAPFRQQDMLDWLRLMLDAEGPKYLVPLDPRTKGSGSQLQTVFGIMSDVLGTPWARGNSYKHYASLATGWMRGSALSSMIAAHVDLARVRGDTQKTSTLIRNLLKDINKIVRFEYVRLTECYSDLLAVALLERGYRRTAERIPPIPLYLEIGACEPRAIGLINMGLSRMTAGLVVPQMPPDLVAEESIVAWLAAAHSRLSLPPLSEREVKRLLGIR